MLPPPTRHRHRTTTGSTAARSSSVALLAVLLPTVIAAVVAMVLTWPSGVGAVAHDAGLVDVGVTTQTARVTSTHTSSCDATIEDARPDGSVPDTVPCLHVDARITTGPRAGQDVEVTASPTITAAQVPDGTRIVVERYAATADSPETWVWSDFERSVPLGTLGMAFVLVAGLVAGWKGLRAVLGLAIAAAILWVYVLPALITGENALVAGLGASVVIMTLVVYLAHGVSWRSTTALVGTIVGLVLIAGIGLLAARASHLSYVASEEDYRLAGLIGDNGVAALRGVFLCGVVLAGLGVLNDVTITQASAVWELRAADPNAGWRSLFVGGMRIGRDHIASTIYTIAFAYAGAALPVLMLLQLYQQPVFRTVTSGVFAEEIVQTLAGSIGLILAIPLTTVLAAWVAVRRTPGPVGAAHAH